MTLADRIEPYRRPAVTPARLAPARALLNLLTAPFIASPTIRFSGDHRSPLNHGSGELHIREAWPFVIAGTAFGNLHISDGACVRVQPDLELAQLPGVNGKITLSNPGTTLQTRGALLAGKAGNGKVLVRDAAKLDSHGVTLGLIPAGKGTLTLAGASWRDSGKVIAGGYGTGLIELQTASRAELDDIAVGGFGRGEMQLSGGAACLCSNAWIGLEQTANGHVGVEGAASSWNIANALSVGHFGIGTLEISNGGAVSAPDINLGTGNRQEIAGEGNVVVRGAASLLEASTFGIGNAGLGRLFVLDGGTARGLSAYVMSSVPGGATATLAGDQTLWQLQELHVGSLGAWGCLTVARNARLQSRQICIAGYNAGSTGIINLGAAPEHAPEPAGQIVAEVITLGMGHAVININHNSAHAVLAARLVADADAGATLNHYHGCTELSGDNSSYGGDVVIHGGHVIVSGKLYGRLIVQGGTVQIEGDFNGALLTAHAGQVSGRGTVNGARLRKRRRPDI